MNNILTHNNKSKTGTSNNDKAPVQERLLRALLTWTFTRNAPCTDCAGAFIIISVRSTLENVLDTYLSSPARTDI